MATITAALTAALLTAGARIPMPRPGLFDWIRDIANDVVLTTIIVAGAITVVATVVVFVASKFSLGKTLMTFFVGAIVTFAVAGGMQWLSTAVSQTVR